MGIIFPDFNNSVESQIMSKKCLIRDDTECQMEGDAILSVQIEKLRKVAELRWDGAIELIRVEVPEKAPLNR